MPSIYSPLQRATISKHFIAVKSCNRFFDRLKGHNHLLRCFNRKNEMYTLFDFVNMHLLSFLLLLLFFFLCGNTAVVVNTAGAPNENIVQNHLNIA